ncbi:hypothetical protein L6164_032978 [Bauhinia variegata]|uniref:Uncharacterized protein n=1 Tax=Bauhinia variegata TaxID=167791 RepID=A0ACB9KQJ9_BAUVA|nr:hypothetical protein L6164_032978 [Bauhinia variegata]
MTKMKRSGSFSSHNHSKSRFWATICQNQGDGLYWKSEEDDIQMQNLKKELQDKEETIIVLKAQLASVKQEKFKKERELDLLKQSLRIINGNKKNSVQPKEKLLRACNYDRANWEISMEDRLQNWVSKI